MRNADRDEVAALLTSVLFRPHNRTSTDHLGSALYPVLPREAQSDFQTGTGLGPILTLEEHSRTTDVFSGALMPVNFIPGSISQRNVQFEPLGPRLLVWSYTASCVQHRLCESRLVFLTSPKTDIHPIGDLPTLAARWSQFTRF
jgi:hypothetical protein